MNIQTQCLIPSLAKVTLRIPGLDSGASAAEAKTEKELEPMEAELHACRRGGLHQ